MNPKFRRIPCLAVLVALAFVGVLAVSPLRAVCYNYSNSHAVIFGLTPSCAGSGGSCGECIGGFGGGFTVCTHDSTGFEMCIDYISW